MVAEYAVRNAQALETLKQDHRVEVEHFPDDVVKALWKAADAVLAELEDVDDITGRTYRSFTAFRKNAIRYSPYGEEGYLRIRRMGAEG